MRRHNVCSRRLVLRATNGRPYNVWCGLACRHIVLFVPFVFYGASRTSPPTEFVGDRLLVRSRKIGRTTLRRDASILRFAPWQVCFANIAPALQTLINIRRVAKRKSGQHYGRFVNRPYRSYFVPYRRGGFHIRPHKINGENKTIRRRTDPHTHCRDRASGQQVASLFVVGKIYFRI